MPETIGLQEWQNASTDQRQRWLENGYILTAADAAELSGGLVQPVTEDNAIADRMRSYWMHLADSAH